MEAMLTQTNKPTPISSSVLGIIMVIVVELMFFGGLISAFVLAEAGKADWPPAEQPRLPFWLTFGNMLILLASAFVLYEYLKRLKKNHFNHKLLKITIVLGIVFFLIQGYEWLRILLFGIHTGTGLFTSFFYTLIGVHGIHVFLGLLMLIYVYVKIQKMQNKETIQNYVLTVGIFWFFVVFLWPVLYYLIYWN